MTYLEEVKSVVTWLKHNHPANVIMPLRKQSKCPVFPHKDGRWCWERAEDFIETSLEEGQPIGILMRDLIAIDLDDRQLISKWEERFPELQKCPKENTRNGAHYLFARPKDCPLTDVAGGLKDTPDGPRLKVDIKTITSTGTSGVLCIAPSPNKTWVRPPGPGPLSPLSPQLCQALQDMRVSVKKEREVDKQETAPKRHHRTLEPSGLGAVEMHSLLSLLSLDRWNNYDSWFRIGLALKREDPTNAKGYKDIFDALSERSANWTPEAADKWDALPSDGTVGLGTIHMWAKQDNPCEYSAYKSRAIKDNLTKLCQHGSVAHYYAAKCVEGLQPGMFVSVDETRKAFYAFYGHRWHLGGESKISALISTELAAALEAKYHELEKELEEDLNSETKQTAKAAELVLQDRKRLWKACFSNDWKNSVVKELQHMLFRNQDNKFLQALDVNPELLGFNNGVLNVVTKEFTEGRPEHMVSKSCGYDFTPVVDQGIRDDILDFFAACHDTKEEVRYCIRSLASCLKGTNQNELFFMWLGRQGANGKGATAELMSNSLNAKEDGYAGTLDISFFTTPTKTSNAATPELACLVGKRFVTSQEPEEGQQLQGGKLKKVSGRDYITTRALYKGIVTWKPQFKIFLQANVLPILNRRDGGTARRVIVQEWSNTFVQHPSLPNERQIDITFKDTKAQSLAWRQQFLLLMLENQVDDLELPPQIVTASGEYDRDCNPLSEWVTDRVEFDPDAKVSKMEWYNDYTAFAAENHQKALGKKQAAQALMSGYEKSHGIRKVTSNGVYYTGMRLLPEEQIPDAFE